MRLRPCLVLLCSLCLGLRAPAAQGGDTVPGQKPLILMEGAFQYIQGTWASYLVTDLVKNETHRLRISVLEQTIQKRAGKRAPYRWMELEVEMEGQPPVVTRLLAEETKQGPGELQKVIVQVQGKSAFSVPQSFFKKDSRASGAEVAQFRTAQAVRRLERKQFRHHGREFEAWVTEAADEAGRTWRAVVSEQLPPIGIYSAESPEMRMQLTDWGTGAKSKIRGPAYPFWVWLAAEAAKDGTK